MNAPLHTPRLLDDAVSLATALHRAGAPAWRVEHGVQALGRFEEAELACFALPTGLQLGDGERVRLVASAGGEPDLDAQEALERAVRAPAPRASLHRTLTALARRPALSGRTTLLAYVAAAIGGALLFDGGAPTVVAGALAGLWVGGLVLLADRLGPTLSRILPVAAAVGATALANAMSHLLQADAEVSALMGLLVLLPGLSLTTGVAEVAAGHLSSGAARLTGAAVTLLLLGLGMAGGTGLVPPAAPVAVDPLPGAVGVGLWLTVWGLAVLFRARRAQVPWLSVGVLVAWGLPLRLPSLAPTAVDFTTAAVLGGLGSLLARQLRQPSQVLTLPGILLLVPGARALGAVGALLRHDLGGVERLADSLATSGALVAGLLLAGLALPPARAS